MTYSYLLSLNREVQQHGGHLAVVLIPREVQVEPSRVLPYVYGDENPPSLDLELPNRQLAHFLDVNRIPYLDLLPALRPLAKGHPLYKYRGNDIHWNEVGLKASARLTLYWLLSLQSRSY